jgi:hypothetical protein
LKASAKHDKDHLDFCEQTCDPNKGSCGSMKWR